MDSTAIDYAPLTRRPDATRVAALRQEALAGAFGRETAKELREEKSGSLIIVTLVGGLLVVIFGGVTISQWVNGEDWSDVSIGLGFTVVIAALAVGMYVLSRRVLRPRAWQRAVRLILFARANGLDAQPRAGIRTMPGALERAGRPRQYKAFRNRVVWTQHGLPVEAATYSDMGGGGRNPDTFEVRYLAVTLPFAPPRSTFRCGRNLGMRGEESAAWVDALGGSEGRSRVMCPRNAVDDVKAFFTPELRAVLTDRRNPANAELAGDRLLIYYARKNALDVTLWKCMFAAVDAVASSVTARQQ